LEGLGALGGFGKSRASLYRPDAGQRTTFTTSGSQTGIEPKNGRATFDVTTAEPGPLNPAVVCPNKKWTATITDVHFSSATLTLTQDDVVIFQHTYPLNT